jgi:hypothetical protein
MKLLQNIVEGIVAVIIVAMTFLFTLGVIVATFLLLTSPFWLLFGIAMLIGKAL